MPKLTFRPSGDFLWAASAACSRPDAPEMFPHDNDHTGILKAKTLCDTCPVRTRCLEDALERGELHGIWGGLDSDERRILKGKRNVA